MMQSGVTELGCGRKIFPAASGLRAPGDAAAEFGKGETPRAAAWGCRRRAGVQRVPLGSGFAPGIRLDAQKAGGEIRQSSAGARRVLIQGIWDK